MQEPFLAEPGWVWDPETLEFIALSEYEARLRSIAASQAGEGGTGGGVGQGQPESAVFSGEESWLTRTVSTVVAAVEAPFQAVGGVLEGVKTTGQYLPWILFGLGAIALVVVLPKGGVYHVQRKRR